MFRRSCGRRGKVPGVGKRVGEVTSNFGEGTEFFRGDGLEQHVVAMLFNQDLGAFEAEGLGQADSLAAPVTKDLGGDHSYKM